MHRHSRVEAWAARGTYVRWTSSVPENAGRGELAVYTQVRGDPTRPALVFVHGYPTSSHDFHRVADLLEEDHYLCLLDLPGYGLSDKPRQGYRYTIADDARLVDHLVRTTFALESFTLVTHDRGDSVGLALLELHQGEHPGYEVSAHVMLNGNIWLPLAALTLIQKALLSGVTGPAVSRLLPTRVFARGLGRRTCTPALDADETAVLAGMLAHQGGMRVQHQLVQYLHERRDHEAAWLESLARSSVPTTLAWGELDTIAPPRVADFVWETALRGRPARSSYWRIPSANHYPQLDQPEVVAAVVRTATGSGDDLVVPGARLIS